MVGADRAESIDQWTAANGITTKIPPLVGGSTSWVKYEELIDDWLDLTVHGVSAFDMVSRRAMLAALRRVPGGDQILPFVRLFYGSQLRCFWEDDAAVVHHILQGEG